MDGARGGRGHEAEGAKIALALSRRGAGQSLGSVALGIGAEQHGAHGHAVALVVALRESMDRERLGINSEQAARGRFHREALGHPLEQVMAAISRKHDGLAAFGDPRSRLALQGEMADHLAAAVARDRRDQLAALDLVPVATRREHLRVNVMMAVDLQEAAGDRRCIAFLDEVDNAALRRHRCRGSGGRRRLGRRRRQLRISGHAAVEADLPSVDPMLAAGDAGVTPEAAGERGRNVGKLGMAAQPDPGRDVLVRAQQGDADAFAAGARCAERQPGLDGVVGDLARDGGGDILGERGFTHEGAHELAVRWFEHEFELGEPRSGMRIHDADRSDVVGGRRLAIVRRSPKRSLSEFSASAGPTRTSALEMRCVEETLVLRPSSRSHSEGRLSQAVSHIDDVFAFKNIHTGIVDVAK